MKKLFVCLIALMVGLSFTYWAMADTDIYNDGKWMVNSTGDLLPVTTNTNSIGSTVYYAKQICLGGSCKTAWSGTGDAEWTSGGAYIYTTLGGEATLKIKNNGDIVTNGTITADDASGFTLANGALISNGTNNEVQFTENSNTLTMNFTGGKGVSINTTVGGITFDLVNTTAGNISLMPSGDGDDYIKIFTSSNQPDISFMGCNGKITAASGTVSFDDDIISTSGQVLGGTANFTSINLTNSEEISNGVDGIVRAATDTGDATLEVYTPSTANEDATLRLTADAGGNDGDTWEIQSDGATNSLLLRNNVTGTMATKFTVTSAGAVTTAGGLTSTGNLLVNTSMANITASNGTFYTEGALVVKSTANITSNLLLNSTKVIMTAANGTIANEGSLDAEGQANITGNLIVNGTAATNMFNVMAKNGTIRTAGSLVVTGQTNLTGDVFVNGTAAANLFSILAEDGDTNVEGNFTVNNTMFAVNPLNGTTTILGSAVITGQENITGSLFLNSTKVLANAHNGTVAMAGEASIAGGANITGKLIVNGTAASNFFNVNPLNGNATVGKSGTGFLLMYNTSGVQWACQPVATSATAAAINCTAI